MSLSSIERKEIRTFGLIAFTFFGCIAVAGIWSEKWIATILFSVLSLSGLLFFILPNPMAPIYRIWLKIAHAIGIIITSCLLILIYYLVITPAGYCKWLFGGRPLPEKTPKDTDSYWISRSDTGQRKSYYEKRY